MPFYVLVSPGPHAVSGAGTVYRYEVSTSHTVCSWMTGRPWSRSVLITGIRRVRAPRRSARRSREPRLDAATALPPPDGRRGSRGIGGWGRPVLQRIPARPVPPDERHRTTVPTTATAREAGGGPGPSCPRPTLRTGPRRAVPNGGTPPGVANAAGQPAERAEGEEAGRTDATPPRSPTSCSGERMPAAAPREITRRRRRGTRPGRSGAGARRGAARTGGRSACAVRRR